VEPPYDSILLVSFGGPERQQDVMPFLERVVQGKRVPRERLLAVAEHYNHFQGASPINGQNRRLLSALQAELRTAGHSLPIYWGNRNWHPLLPQTIRRMAADGRRSALAFVTSAFSSYSSCRQYLENIAAAREQVGDDAPAIHKLRAFFNHPGFVEPQSELVQAAIGRLSPALRGEAELLFTAHSIPAAMAQNSRYEAQLHEAARLVAEAVAGSRWRVVYQSRSGPPNQPWLEPDVCDYLEDCGEARPRAVVIVPIGFASDHLEVLYDLDVEARDVCRRLGIEMVRAATVGTHHRFVRMIRELIEERLVPGTPRIAIGDMEAAHDDCPSDCCLYQGRPAEASP
jgi:protoporphyrin/coproporphyrin ferrochelatase